MDRSIFKLLITSLLLVSFNSYSGVKERVWDQQDSAIAHALLATYNSNSPEITEAFCRAYFSKGMLSYFSMERHINDAETVFKNYGVLNFHAIVSLEANPESDILSFLATSEETGDRVNLRIWLSKDSDRKIEGLQNRLPRYEDLPLPERSISMRNLRNELGAYLEKMEGMDKFSGTVLLAKKDKIIFREAYGFSSKRYGVKNNVSTKLNLGSQNKMFTSVAILQLVESGKISLDDPLSRYLSAEWLPKSVSSKINIRHLLTHSSGLGDFFNEDFSNTPTSKISSFDDYMPFVVGDTLKFTPGDKYLYSNIGMLLLGVVIETVTQQDYFKYIQENVYQPSGMKNSGTYDIREPVNNLATGYYKSEDGMWLNNMLLLPARGSSAGGGYSTADDLHSFSLALTSHKLLTPEYTRLLFTPPAELTDSEYGHGFHVQTNRISGDRLVGHNGGFPGVATFFDMHLDHEIVVVVLSNYSSGSDRVVSKIRELIGQVTVQK